MHGSTTLTYAHRAPGAHRRSVKNCEQIQRDGGMPFALERGTVDELDGVVFVCEKILEWPVRVGLKADQINLRDGRTGYGPASFRNMASVATPS